MSAVMKEPQISRPVAQFIGSPKKLLIDGKWLPAVSEATFEVKNPASGATIARAAEGDKLDVDAAVRAARRAFESGPWPAMTPSERSKIVWRIGDLISKYADELAELESLDNGKPMAVARVADVPLAADIFQYMAGWCTKIEGKTIPLSVLYTPGVQYHSYTRPEPIGVVGQIIPWNFPLLMAAWKLAPALATGCTVVLKVAEETPLTALRLGEIMQEAGLPPGVVNIITGFGETAGAALAAHPGVDKVAFTGSTEVGRLIVQAAARDLKHVSLELGGKSPNIILEDADLDVAIPGTASAIFFNHGQCCCAGSRLYVHERAVRQSRSRSVGSSQDDQARLGPRSRHADGPDGIRDPARSRLQLPGTRQARGCPGGDWRQGARGVRVLRRTDRVRRYQARHENRQGGDLWSGGDCDAVCGSGRCAGPRGQRHDLWSGGRNLDPRCQQSACAGCAPQGRDGMDQLLQHLRCGVAIWRIQTVWLGP